jgi:hypothetical protein
MAARYRTHFLWSGGQVGEDGRRFLFNKWSNREDN